MLVLLTSWVKGDGDQLAAELHAIITREWLHLSG
jgi:hypothetical protein